MMASEQLWEQFSGPLHHFIQRRVPDAASADDLLQEVFLRVHTRIGTLEHTERPAAWLYQIARNLIADWYRAHRPMVAVPATLAAADEPPDDAVLRALAPCVRAMRDELPAPYREALALTVDAGVSQKTLSDQLGLSFSGAKSRVQRARAHLKAQLLACCQFHFDSAGRIIAYAPHRPCAVSGCDSCCA